jgi:AcrR family transcriptional regulator
MTPKGQKQRDHILAVAEQHFAQVGFLAASMRDLALKAELPLATLGYHFARKEQLYAAVLDAINAELVALLDASTDLAPLVDWCLDHPERLTFLVRELIDNQLRVAQAERLPLREFLVRASALAGSELALLHLVGGITYVTAAWPTVSRVVGATRRKQIQTHYRAEAHAFAALVTGGPREPSHRTNPGQARARAPRGADDRRGSGAVGRAGLRVPR